MRTAVLTLIMTAFVITGTAAGFIYAGIYNVAADEPHWPLTHRLLELVRIRSIRAHASSLTPPKDLESDARLVVGTEHFAAHCAICHGAPGVPRGEIAKGLYPRPPDLAQTAQRYTPGEIFWIIKNGIKMSAMPSWADHSDDELWSTVGFIEKLPDMNESAYAKLVMQSLMQGSHHHHDGAGQESMPDMPGPDGNHAR